MTGLERAAHHVLAELDGFTEALQILGQRPLARQVEREIAAPLRKALAAQTAEIDR